MQCGRYRRPGLSRRQWLAEAGAGFGAVALTALLADEAAATAASVASAGASPQHHPPRARSVIFLYMDGGPSQVDTFDPKPRLLVDADKPASETLGKVSPTQFSAGGRIMPALWAFGRHGESGHAVSELFPHVAGVADELCVVRSMTSQFPEHTGANYLLHTGSGVQGRPSMGAWVGYALGSASRSLPGFVVLNGGLTPPGGLDNFGAGFLPASFQGSVLQPGSNPMPNIKPGDAPGRQRVKLDLIADLDAAYLEQTGSDAVASAIANYETAARMQTAVPELLAIDGESQATHRLYGLDSKNGGTATFARQCLLARRLVERGVRFVELTCPNVQADRWDQHRNLMKGHTNNALNVDQPIAALLTDLQSRGLLDDTLVVWAGEFGRTPYQQGKTGGRDHNPSAFTIWMAGGGTRAGTVYGRTDDYGYRVVENRLDIHDLHATMLHLLGVDHERATVRHSGRDMRLTDVHGRVIGDLLA